MPVTTVTSRDFNREPSRVKKAALGGPVVVTERGKPAYALLRYDDYARLKGGGGTLADFFEGLPVAEIGLEPMVKERWQFHEVDFD